MRIIRISEDDFEHACDAMSRGLDAKTALYNDARNMARQFQEIAEKKDSASAEAHAERYRELEELRLKEMQAARRVYEDMADARQS